MALISSSIPNLINGVSQQSDELRLPSHSEIQENAYSSIVEGLKKRSPTRYVAKIHDGDLGEASVHHINRDASERYEVIITDGNLQVFDLMGNEKVVNSPEGTDYLSSGNAHEDFRCVTIADYTFVVNTSLNVEMAEEMSPDRGTEALVFIEQANYSTDYTISVDGTEHGSFSTSSSGDLKTTAIASNLEGDLTANLPAGFVVAREGAVIHIRKEDGSDFEIKALDSRSNQNISVFKNKVQRFSELPTIAPTGFTLEVLGDQSSSFDNYYVKFVPNNDSADFDYGLWEETVKPNIPWKFDATTMPHILVREADGTFTFKPADWGSRSVGDEDSAPNPTFVGRTINDLYFFENRLGVLSDSNSIHSRATEFFEFFPSTVTTTVDSDPIDQAASTNEVSILRHAVPFKEDLILFSDQAQFTLDYGDVFNNETTKIKTLTEYESSLSARPVGAGKTVFFAIEKGQYSGMREIYVEANTQTNDASEITAHVPRYIPAGIFKIAAASNEEVVFALTRGERNAIYVYKYYWEGSEKLQSSWSKFIVGGSNTKILNVEFINTDCYLIVQRPDGAYLETLSVEPGRVDDFSDYETLLDRRVDETQCLSISYDEVSDSTTFTMPYSFEVEPVVFTRQNAPVAEYSPGVITTITDWSENTVTVSGDLTARGVFIGEPYVMRYRFSKQTLKEDAQGGGRASVATGRLQLRTWTVVFDNTGYFRLEVRPHWKKDPFVYKFTGKILGTRSATVGRVGLSSGRKRAGVASKSDRVDIEIVNDSCLPSNFLSAEWEALFVSRTKRV